MRALLLLRGSMFCYVGDWVVRSWSGRLKQGVLGAARRTFLDELRGLLVLGIVMTVAACGDGMSWLEGLWGVAELELLQYLVFGHSGRTSQ